MATRRNNLGSQNSFKKALDKAESADATLQAFKGMETLFGESTLLSTECFLVTKKLFELNAFKQVIRFAYRIITAYLTTNDAPTRLISANVLCLMADSFLKLKKYDESLRYLNLASTILRKLVEDNNLSAVEIVLNIQTKMSTVKEAMGSRQETVVHALNMLEIKGKTLEVGCVELGDANMAVSDAYLSAWDHKSALPYCTKALGIYEKHLGKDSNNASAVETLLDIHRKIYNIKVAMGNRKEAVVHVLNILEIRKKTLEEDFVELGDAYMSVTDAYLRAFDHKSALPYCTKALEIYEKHLGKDSVEGNNASAVETLLDIHRKMFTIKDAMGNREEAIVHVLNILEISEKTLEKDCVELGDANMSVTDVYLRVFDHKSALPFCTKALEIYEKKLGKNSMEVAEVRRRLAVIYHERKEYNKSLEFSRSAVSVMMEICPGSPELLITEIEGAYTMIELADYKDAVEAMESVVARDDLQGGLRVKSFLTMAKALCFMRKFADARKFMNEPRRVLEGKEIDDPVLVSIGFVDLSSLYVKINELETAISTMLGRYIEAAEVQVEVMEGTKGLGPSEKQFKEVDGVDDDNFYKHHAFQGGLGDFDMEKHERKARKRKNEDTSEEDSSEEDDEVNEISIFPEPFTEKWIVRVEVYVRSGSVIFDGNLIIALKNPDYWNEDVTEEGFAPPPPSEDGSTLMASEILDRLGIVKPDVLPRGLAPLPHPPAAIRNAVPFYERVIPLPDPDEPTNPPSIIVTPKLPIPILTEAPIDEQYYAGYNQVNLYYMMYGLRWERLGRFDYRSSYYFMEQPNARISVLLW